MTLEEKQSVIESALAANPRFVHPVYRENLARVAVETQIKKQEIDGHHFTTIFLTHNTIPSAYRSNPNFCIAGDARYFKSITMDENFRALSIGVPHFFNLENFRELEAFSQWQPSFRFMEKHDGTCFLITVHDGVLMVRSRRKIYTITSDLTCLNFPGYDFGTRVASLCEQLRHRGDFTILTEAIFPHPAIRPSKLTPFYKQVMRGAGFCPFVDYPAQDNFLNGIVWHEPLRLEPQESLDRLCAEHGIHRPKTILFESLKDAEGWLRKKTNAEGFCVYFNGDQSIFKFKTRWYRRVRNTTGEIFALLRPPSGVTTEFPSARSEEIASGS